MKSCELLATPLPDPCLQGVGKGVARGDKEPKCVNFSRKYSIFKQKGGKMTTFRPKKLYFKLKSVFLRLFSPKMHLFWAIIFHKKYSFSDNFYEKRKMGSYKGNLH